MTWLVADRKPIRRRRPPPITVTAAQLHVGGLPTPTSSGKGAFAGEQSDSLTGRTAAFSLLRGVARGEAVTGVALQA